MRQRPKAAAAAVVVAVAEAVGERLVAAGGCVVETAAGRPGAKGVSGRASSSSSSEAHDPRACRPAQSTGGAPCSREQRCQRM